MLHPSVIPGASWFQGAFFTVHMCVGVPRFCFFVSCFLVALCCCLAVGLGMLLLCIFIFYCV